MGIETSDVRRLVAQFLENDRSAPRDSSQCEEHDATHDANCAVSDEQRGAECQSAGETEHDSERRSISEKRIDEYPQPPAQRVRRAAAAPLLHADTKVVAFD